MLEPLHPDAVGGWRERVDVALSDGMRLNLSDEAARARAEQYAPLIDEIAGDSLTAIRLLTADLLASSHEITDHMLATVTRIERMAARLGDDVSSAYALLARAVTQPTPEHVESRQEAARRILDIAERCGETQLVPLGYYLLMVALLELGQIHLIDAAILDRDHRPTTGSVPGSFDPAGWFTCLRSILDGDTDLAEKQATELFCAAESTQSNAQAVYATHLGIIAWMRGDIDGAEAGFLAARRAYPHQLLWSASLAWLWLGQGRRAAADALVRSLPPPEHIRRDRYWLSTITVLAQIAIIHGSRERAEQLRHLIAPFAHHLISVGTGVAFWGTTARTLGLLEERLGMLAEAREHLELAIEISSRVGAQAWLAEAQIELAEFAIRHDINDIPAYDLLAEARRTCQARGFAALETRAVHPARIRVFGHFEVISTDGEVAEWNSRKARELLKMLVAARGVATSREVLMEHLWPGHDPAVLSNRFAVAVNTIRRALDPKKSFARHHHLVVDGEAVRLDLNHVDSDLERFFSLVQEPGDVHRDAAAELLARGVFPDNLYSDWAITIRDEVSHAWTRHTT